VELELKELLIQAVLLEVELIRTIKERIQLEMEQKMVEQEEMLFLQEENLHGQ